MHSVETHEAAKKHSQIYPRRTESAPFKVHDLQSGTYIHNAHVYVHTYICTSFLSPSCGINREKRRRDVSRGGGDADDTTALSCLHVLEHFPPMPARQCMYVWREDSNFQQLT